MARNAKNQIGDIRDYKVGSQGMIPNHLGSPEKPMPVNSNLIPIKDKKIGEYPSPGISSSGNG